MHSRVLGWLMTPTGRHGLGSAFLRAFLGEIWPEDRLIDDGPVTIALELTQSGESGMTGEILEARADIVIRTGSLVVVVENKVGAGEQPRQCERLYWAWANEPIETRWIYLTPSGRKPISAESGVARDAWACLSYPGVRRALGVALEEATGDDRVRGRESARQYLWTLEAHL